ncbi:hypothetical protein [Ruminococcus sp.]|uniref:hypothetical protein n=1 Tax=Ruminococcus sp. TaxID=41978 RepID=UPI002600BA47|nr:hypothetical protein [Ruminococcus sp.]
MFKNKNAILIIGVIGVAFSLVVFLLPFEWDENFWIAYIFEITAIIIQIPVFKIAFDKNETIKSKVLGFPVFRVGYIYLFIQTVVSLAIIISGGFTDIPFFITLLICIVILASALFFSISVDMAREVIEQIDDANINNTSNMIELRKLSAGLSVRTNDQFLKTELQKLAEAFRFSDPVSADATLQTEKELQINLNELASMLSDGSADVSDIQAIHDKLTERNEICKLNKKH